MNPELDSLGHIIEFSIGIAGLAALPLAIAAGVMHYRPHMQ